MCIRDRTFAFRADGAVVVGDLNRPRIAVLGPDGRATPPAPTQAPTRVESAPCGGRGGGHWPPGLSRAHPPETSTMAERPAPPPIQDRFGAGRQYHAFGGRMSESQQTSVDEIQPEHGHRKASLATMCVGAVGVVFGDIGTSPLYAMKEAFNGPHALLVTSGNILGILSLVFWAMTITVTFKYVKFITRADNRGEGGIMALTALVPGGSGTAG